MRLELIQYSNSEYIPVEKSRFIGVNAGFMSLTGIGTDQIGNRYRPITQLSLEPIAVRAPARWLPLLALGLRNRYKEQSGFAIWMDYLDWLEAEYDIRIDARDLSDSIHENVDQYQAEFDAMVLDFYDAVDKIEKEAFDTCDSIEERNSSDADERMNEVLRETSDGISKESGRLAERLNSLNQKFSRRPSSSLLRQSTTM